jgi:hypothetical protein
MVGKRESELGNNASPLVFGSNQSAGDDEDNSASNPWDLAEPVGVPPSGGGKQNLWFCLTLDPVVLVPPPTGALGLVTPPPCPTGLLWSLRVVVRVGRAGHSLERRQAKVSYNSSTLAGASGDLTLRTVYVMDSCSPAS